MVLMYVLLGLAVVIYFMYVSLIKKKNNLKESLAGIEVQLKKRLDLIPNLLKAAAKYMEHEKNIFDEVAKVRENALKASNYNEKFMAENKLSDLMHTFYARAEAYPELKSDKAVVTAQEGMIDVEEHIAAARRFYNSAVKEYKNALEIFPSSLIAMMMGLKDEYPFFEAEEKAKEAINVDEYLK